MKKAVATLLAACLFFFITPVYASDQLVEAKVSKVMEKADKNGDPFSIVVIEEERNLNGVAYTAEVIATAFRSAHEEAQLIKEGDVIKFIGSKRQYNGDTTYTIRKILK